MLAYLTIKKRQINKIEHIKLHQVQIYLTKLLSQYFLNIQIY